MREGNRRGQSILEYTLLLGAIIAIIVTVLLGTGGMQGKISTAYNKSGRAVENISNESIGVFK